MANTDYIKRLRTVIHRLYQCDATHLETVPVKETFNGQTIWDGNVEVFSVSGHARARKCYAWGAKMGTPQEHYKAILNLPPVQTPLDAVKVSILIDFKKTE